MLYVEFDVDCSFVLDSRRFRCEIGLSYVTGIFISFVVNIMIVIISLVAAAATNAATIISFVGTVARSSTAAWCIRRRNSYEEKLS